MIRLPFGKKKTPGKFWVLDIGPVVPPLSGGLTTLSVVRALIFSCEEKPRIIWWGETEEAVPAGRQEENLLKEAKSTLEESPPRQAVVSVPGREAQAQVVKVRFSRQEPQQPLSEGELAGFEEKVRQTVLAPLREQWVPLSFKLFGARMDDLRVTNPLGFKGKKLELSFSSTLASVSILESLEKTVSSLGLRLRNFSLGMAALPQVLPQSYPSDLILLEIRRTQTSVGVVFGGELAGITTFLLGAQALGEEGAPGYWCRALEEALRSFRQAKAFPPSFLLLGEGAATPQVKEETERYSWQEALSFPSPPRVEVLNPKTFAPLLGKIKKELCSPEWAIPLSLGMMECKRHGQD
ncbi:MAG: hypothetical protein U9R03_00005 [Candidatus Aerophobetes bacterium]|nr:hypothetical protein [Candidatus Aerophobetes bacterium]